MAKRRKPKQTLNPYYLAGKNAARAGAKRKDNPYKKTSEQRLQWYRGWASINSLDKLLKSGIIYL